MRIVFSSMCAIVACSLTYGQTEQPRLAFEVVSVKPSDSGQAIAFKRSGYRIATTSTSLEWLITWAYDVHNDRLYGKPNWLDSVRYDIVANAPDESKPVPREPGQAGPFQLMMRTFLAERFKLAIHRETRNLPMYALVVPKTGIKLHLMEAGNPTNQSPFSMPGSGRLIGNQVSAEMFAKVLSNQLGATVRDETGLKGVFDFTLEWDPSTLTNGAEADRSSPADTRAGSSIFIAIQEQLGLGLEARKGPVEVLVIDHIDRTPTEN